MPLAQEDMVGASETTLDASKSRRFDAPAMFPVTFLCLQPRLRALLWPSKAAWGSREARKACRKAASPRSCMAQAVRQHGCALEFASEELRSDREVVQEAGPRRSKSALRSAFEAVNRTPRSLMMALGHSRSRQGVSTGGLAEDPELEDFCRAARLHDMKSQRSDLKAKRCA